ncbi:unnamed protein product [Didymodactylos carnosus]|uniref:Cytochrome b5 heme-binding domain-containing protein n=1 Tax=Didymodactylos carnosus TaxID=1234261 RepID=A0A815G8T7_9BILA|nr:unnamed protein product [Didymodactylos carnosus]CAF4192607.1 unnamed protein product [Didymodactylos carnosus]
MLFFPCYEVINVLHILNNLQSIILNNLLTQSKRKEYTLKEVSNHYRENDCWMIIRDIVYDLTNFIKEHPGGHDIMMEYAGSDATMAFTDKPHSKHASRLLQKYIVGELVFEERMYDNMSQELTITEQEW